MDTCPCSPPKTFTYICLLYGSHDVQQVHFVDHHMQPNSTELNTTSYVFFFTVVSVDVYDSTLLLMGTALEAVLEADLMCNIRH